MLIARDPLPLEFMLRRIHVLVVEAVSQVTQGSLVAEPLAGLEVRDGFADTKLHEQMGPAERELREGSALVVFVERLEVRLELRVFELAERESLKRAIAILVKREDVVHARFRPQPDLHVVTEDKLTAANVAHVTRRAVVLGR
jgi:hypothetical protein